MSLLPRKKGRDLRIRNSTGMVISVARSKSISIDNRTVDVTSDEFVELLARPGSKQIAIEVSGFTNDKGFIDIAVGSGISLLDSYTIEYLDGAGLVEYEITGSWFLASFVDRGQSDSGLEYSASLLSSLAYSGQSLYPIVTGSIIISDTTSSGLTLSWTKATDPVTPQIALEYQIYQSLSNNISTVAAAEENGTIIQAYTADINTFDVSGLNLDTTYYFNIVVRNESGLKTAYTTVSATITFLSILNQSCQWADDPVFEHDSAHCTINNQKNMNILGPTGQWVNLAGNPYACSDGQATLEFSVGPHDDLSGFHIGVVPQITIFDQVGNIIRQESVVFFTDEDTPPYSGSLTADCAGGYSAQFGIPLFPEIGTWDGSATEKILIEF